MNPLASIGTGLGISLLQKWWEKRQAAKAASALPPPPEFTPAQMNYFTRALPEKDAPEGRGRFRAFSVDTNQVTLAILGARSAVPVAHPNLQQYGQVWRVVPLQPGAPTALAVVEAAHKDPSQVVVGSLSLVLLPNGSPVPMILVVGPPAAQMLTVREGVIAHPDGSKPAGAFAQITPVLAEPTQAEIAADVKAEVDPFAETLAKQQVGATPPAAAAEVVTVTAPADLPPAKRNGRATAPKIEPAIIAEHVVTTEK